jgi:hypothetical protein
MTSLQTVPLYGKHWPPVVDILVQLNGLYPKNPKMDELAGTIEFLGVILVLG